MFSIALKHEGEDFDTASASIDSEYSVASGKETERHGGNFKTFVRVFEEAGWMHVKNENGNSTLQVTPAGRQAEQLLIKIPDFLKAVPAFFLNFSLDFSSTIHLGPTRERIRRFEIRHHAATFFRIGLFGR